MTIQTHPTRLVEGVPDGESVEFQPRSHHNLDQLYMTVDEQRQALLDSGFSQIGRLLCKGDLVLHRAKV